MKNMKAFLKKTINSAQHRKILSMDITDGFILIDVFVSLLMMATALTTISGSLFVSITSVSRSGENFKVFLDKDNNNVAKRMFIYEKE